MQIKYVQMTLTGLRFVFIWIAALIVLPLPIERKGCYRGMMNPRR